METKFTAKDSLIHQKFAKRSVYLMVLVTFLAFMALIGWEFDVRFIKHPLPHLIAMNPLSAVSFLTTGISFFLLRRLTAPSPRTVIAYIFATVPIVIGFLRVTEILGGTNFGLDRLFYADAFDAEKASNLSNHIALNTAFVFICIGSGVILTFTQSAFAKKIASAGGTLIVLLALFAFLGYIFNITLYSGILTYFPVSVYTAIGFLLTGLALIFANADSGFMKVVFLANAAGTTARILIPAAIIIPIVLGYLRLSIDWNYPISVELGTSYLIISIIIVFFSIILFTSVLIGKKDDLRQVAEDKLVDINNELERKIDERTQEISRNERFFRALIENSADAILLTDRNFEVTFQSPGAERMTGISLAMRKANPRLRYTHPDELDIVFKARETALAMPGIPIPFQSRFLHRDGYYIWIEGVMTNLTNDKDINGLAFNYRDVTERKKMEERQNVFVSMVNLSDDAIISITLDGIISSWNGGAARLYGFTDKEAIGADVSIIVPRHLKREEEKMRFRVSEGETINQYETERKKKDGSYVTISLSASPIKDFAGRVIGVSKIGRDITDRKEAEKNLQLSEKRFRALIENISDGIVLNDEHSVVLYQSPSVERILGYSLEERRQTKVLDNIHPDYQESFKALYEQLRKEPGRPLQFQYMFKHKLGHYIWLEGVVTNLTNDPSVNAYVANYRDVTDRKKAEENLTASENRFRALIENSVDGIVLVDINSNVIYRSPAATRMRGPITEDEDGIFGPHPDEAAQIREKFLKAVQEPGKPVAFQGRFLFKKDRLVWLEGSLTSLLHVPGVNAIVLNYQDITERKNSEAEILKLNSGLEEIVAQRTSQLEIVNKELEAFTYSVSHDLRAPLRIINGFSEILMEDNFESLDEKGQKTLQTIVRNAKRMGQLIDDLLEFSRVGRTVVRTSRIDMNQQVKDALIELETSGVPIPKNLVIQPLEATDGDGNLVRQVWINLISNAIKYSGRKDNPAVEIGMMHKDDERYYFVKDNGAGFDMTYAHKLFGVFQRLHKQEDFSGTGVGLALVHRIISKHNGKIAAESVVDEGATFYFRLNSPASIPSV